MSTLKESRMAVRMTDADDAVIRAAAAAEGLSVTDFMVTAAAARARDALADRRTFVLDDAQMAEFQAILDRPVVHKPALAKLFAEPSIFTDEA
jgi:uncharacterized protein (DUF1778 family)